MRTKRRTFRLFSWNDGSLSQYLLNNANFITPAVVFSVCLRIIFDITRNQSFYFYFGDMSLASERYNLFLRKWMSVRIQLCPETALQFHAIIRTFEACLIFE